MNQNLPTLDCSTALVNWRIGKSEYYDKQGIIKASKQRLGQGNYKLCYEVKVLREQPAVGVSCTKPVF